MTEKEMSTWKQAVWEKIECIHRECLENIKSLQRTFHDIKYGNLLGNIEERIDKLEQEDLSLRSPNLQALKLIERIRRLEEKVEELSEIIIPYFESPEKSPEHSSQMNSQGDLEIAIKTIEEFIAKEKKQFEENRFKSLGSFLKSALDPRSQQQDPTSQTYIVNFDKDADLWRSSAVIGDKVLCASVGYTRRDAFDNLIASL